MIKSGGGGSISNFIYNDLKGARQGGPLMDGKDGATASTSGPKTRVTKQ